MPDRTWDDDPTIPPPGCRTGTGSGSILPYLVKSLAARPRDGDAPPIQQPPSVPSPSPDGARRA
jgi:hypothetical protein